MGERLLCKQEVTGSNPVGSTSLAGTAPGMRSDAGSDEGAIHELLRLRRFLAGGVGVAGVVV